ncbi:MAG: hypothetical protein WDN46_23830 [Methylocella sp.]
MKIPMASVMNTPALSPSRNRISMASMLRTKLSLNAEKNWHQNKGAKRRLHSRSISPEKVERDTVVLTRIVTRKSLR